MCPILPGGDDNCPERNVQLKTFHPNPTFRGKSTWTLFSSTFWNNKL
jgi:hypothetical protein